MQEQQQYIRMAHILARLKAGGEIGIPQLRQSLLELGERTDVRLECGEKTILRDIGELKRLGCPLKYHRSPKCRSYELTDKSWELSSAPLLGGDEILAVALGAQFAAAFLPKAVAARVQEVADGIFKANTEDFLKIPDLSAIRLLAYSPSEKYEGVFATLFECWKNRRMVTIAYRDEKHGRTERTIEPQAFLFHEMAWYVRAFCYLRMDSRTFAVARIESAKPLDVALEPKPEIYRDFTPDNFDPRDAYTGIRIRLTPKGRQYALVHPLHSRQRIAAAGDSFTMEVPEKARHLATSWILAQRGKARPIAPAQLVEDVRTAATAILKGLEDRQENTRCQG